MKNIQLKLKPFECEHCDAKFGRKENWRAHVKTVHEEIMPHKCKICERAFATRSGVKDHMKTHSTVE